MNKKEALMIVIQEAVGRDPEMIACDNEYAELREAVKVLTGRDIKKEYTTTSS